MKLPFTDKFLWMVYNFLEETGEILETTGIFKLPSWRRLVPLDDEFWRNFEKKQSKKQFAQFVNYLKKKGYIQIAKLKEKEGILLTPKGKRKVLKTKFLLESPSELKRRKDEKFLMAIFDIPEKKRQLRDEFRNILLSLGFQRFQKSVWISPFDVQKQLEEVIRIYDLENYVRIFLIREIEI